MSNINELRELREREFQPSRQLYNAAESQYKHLNYRWTPVLVLFILLAVVALVIGIISYVDSNNNVNMIYNNIKGTYGSVKAASTAPIFGRLALKLAADTSTYIIDGITINIGDSVLLKDELNSQNNGLYTLTVEGYVRSVLMNQASQVTPGNSVYIAEGTVNGGASFMLFNDFNNSSATINDITGHGVIYNNTNNIILGIDTQAPSTGFVPSYDPNLPTQLKWTALTDLGILPENGTGIYPNNSIAVWSNVNKINDSGSFVNPLTGELETPSIFLNNALHIEPFVGPVSTIRFPDNSAALVNQVLAIDTILPGPIITTKWQPDAKLPDNGNIVYVKTTSPLIPPFEYNTIQAAITYVSTQSPSATNPWQIWIYPGVYNETGLVVPSFVNISGTSQGAVIIQGDVLSPTHIFTLEDNSALYNLTIQGPTMPNVVPTLPGKAGIYVTQADFAVQMFSVTVSETDVGIYLENGNGNNVFCYANDCALSECAFRALLVDSTASLTETVNFYGFSTSYYASDGNPISLLVEIKGTQSIYNSIGEECERDPPVGLAHGTFLEISQGGSARVTGLNMLYFGLGVSIPNDGFATDFTASGIDFFACLMNIDNQNPSSIGYFSGETLFSKTVYPINGQWFISNKNPRILTVGNNSGSDFQDIASALASIVAPSSMNRFIIQVAPGIFSLTSTLTMKPFVTLRGTSQTDTVLQAVLNIDMINIVPDSSVQNLNMIGFVGAGSSHAALNFDTDGAGLMTIQNIIIQGHPIGIRIANPPGSARILLSECIFTTSNETTHCIEITCDNQLTLNVESCVYTSPDANVLDPFQCFLYSTSAGALNPNIFITMTNTRLEMPSIGSPYPGTGICIVAGILTTVSCSVSSFTTGFEVVNSLNTPQFNMESFACENCGTDINILNINPLTIGTITGNLTRSKVIIPTTTNVSVVYNSTEGITLSGQLFQGPNNTESTNITQQIQQGAQLGVINGGDITVVGNVVSVTSGNGYVMQGVFPTDYLQYISWLGQSTVLPNLSYSYVYINNVGTLLLSSSSPNTTQNVLLGTVLSDTIGNELIIQEVPKIAVHLATDVNTMLNNALGPVFVGGCIVSNTGLQLSMIQGTYYFGNLLFSPSAKVLLDPFLLFYQGGTLNGWNFSSGNVNTPIQWDNVGTLTAITLGSFIKHLFYVIGDGLNQEYALVYAQQEFASLGAATVGPLPTSPPFLIQNAVTIASIIVDSAGAIVTVLDERPSLSFRSGTLTATANHSSLTNLTADDHKQYLLVDGTRPMAGNLDMGTQNVITAGTYNGVTVEAHASRHNPGGLDALAIGAPVTIGTANSIGIAASYAISDHVHAHGAQTDPTLHAIATGIANGFMSAADKTKLDGATPLDSLSTLMQRSATGTFQSRAHTLFDTTGAQAVTLAGSTGTTPYTLTFPIDDGIASQVLTTDGTGITTWTTPTTGTVTSVATGTGLTGGPITTTGTISFADVAVQTVMVNNTALPAPPTPVNPAIGSLLTNDGTTLFLPAGGAGQVLTSHTPGVALTWETPTTGTVTSVATGTGLTGGTITSTGTISFANVGVQTVMVNDTALLAPPTPVNPAIGSLLTNDGTTLFLPAGTVGKVLTSNGVGVALTWNSTSSLIVPFVILYNPASGTVSEALAAATWNDRNFDTLLNPTGSTAVTIAGTVGVPAPNFTLAAGTWMMSASAPAYRVTNHMIRLVTSAAPAVTIFSGTSEQANNSANSAQTRSLLNYTWTIGASTEYIIKHYTTIAPGAATLGQPLSLAGINETYTTIHLIKLA